jgi:hypothetical protein
MSSWLLLAVAAAAAATSACDKQGTPAAPGSATAGSGSAGSASARGIAPVAIDAMIDRDHVAVPAAVPHGPYIVDYNCFHSDMPWGKGSQTYNLSFDLGRKQISSLSYNDPGHGETAVPAHVEPGQGEPPLGQAAPPPKPTIAALAPARVAEIGGAVDKLLHGGPYREEYPPSEGTACTLKVRVDGAEPFFTLEKASTSEHDAASALVQALHR